VKLMHEFDNAIKRDGQLICNVKASLTVFFRCAILTTSSPAR